MRTTRLSLISFAAALIVAAPAVMTAPALAQGSAGEFRYEAYLAKQAKIQAAKTEATAEQKATVGTSEVSTFAATGTTNGGRHFVIDVPLDQEQNYRGN